MLEEELFVSHGYFSEGFELIRDEYRANDLELLDSFCGEALEPKGCVGRH